MGDVTTSAPDLNYYRAIAAAQHERDRAAEDERTIEAARERRERVERKAAIVRAVLGLTFPLDGWETVDPGKGLSYRNRDHPDVILQRTFDDLLVEVGAKTSGDNVIAFLRRDPSGGGWTEFIYNNTYWMNASWSEEDKLTMFALAVEDAAADAEQRRERERWQQTASEPLASPPPVCRHDWHAVLARYCPLCSALEGQPSALEESL